MRVLNQLDYENILYPTSLVKGEQPAEPYPSVAKAGCGLICACMLVSILTDKQLEPREAVRISVRAGANHFGTDMPIFAKEIAEQYGLELSSGSSKEELMNGLRAGAVAIIHAGKPKGLFSDGGHFVLAAKAEPLYLFLFYATTENRQPKRGKITIVLMIFTFITACLIEVKWNLPLMKKIL